MVAGWYPRYLGCASLALRLAIMSLEIQAWVFNLTFPGELKRVQSLEIWRLNIFYIYLGLSGENNV